MSCDWNILVKQFLFLYDQLGLVPYAYWFELCLMCAAFERFCFLPKKLGYPFFYSLIYWTKLQSRVVGTSFQLWEEAKTLTIVRAFGPITQSAWSDYEDEPGNWKGFASYSQSKEAFTTPQKLSTAVSFCVLNCRKRYNFLINYSALWKLYF